jgi:hypothetical protein
MSIVQLCQYKPSLLRIPGKLCVEGGCAAAPQSRRSASFFSSCRNWDSPTTSPAGEYASPPFRGEGHSRSREKEWEGPNSDKGTDTVVLNVFYVLCEQPPPTKTHQQVSETSFKADFALASCSRIHRSLKASLKCG